MPSFFVVIIGLDADASGELGLEISLFFGASWKILLRESPIDSGQLPPSWSVALIFIKDSEGSGLPEETRDCGDSLVSERGGQEAGRCSVCRPFL